MDECEGGYPCKTSSGESLSALATQLAKNDCNGIMSGCGERFEDLRRKVAERDRQIAERDEQIADAEKQIADLERQLALRKRNSTNSSKPPCSDGLAGEQRPRGRMHKSKRKPGGQPGHPGIIEDWSPPPR